VIYTVEELLIARKTLVEYLGMKTVAEDWHGVADAAADLRELDVAVKLTRELTSGR